MRNVLHPHRWAVGETREPRTAPTPPSAARAEPIVGVDSACPSMSTTAPTHRSGLIGPRGGNCAGGRVVARSTRPARSTQRARSPPPLTVRHQPLRPVRRESAARPGSSGPLRTRGASKRRASASRTSGPPRPSASRSHHRHPVTPGRSPFTLGTRALASRSTAESAPGRRVLDGDAIGRDRASSAALALRYGSGSGLPFATACRHDDGAERVRRKRSQHRVDETLPRHRDQCARYVGVVERRPGVRALRAATASPLDPGDTPSSK